MQEPVTRTEYRNVIRCDKCAQKIEDKSRMTIVVYHWVPYGTRDVKNKQFQLCEYCSANEMGDMHERRERIKYGGVSDAEQEALLKGLFKSKSRRNKR